MGPEAGFPTVSLVGSEARRGAFGGDEERILERE